VNGTAERPPRSGAGEVVVLGSLNIDITVSTPHIVRPGETVLGGPARFLPGGKGANQAVSAAQLGGAVSMLGCVGGDEFGTALRTNLQMVGVDDAYLRTLSDERSGLALVSVEPGGENAIVVSPGANSRVAEDYLGACEPVIRAARIAVTQMETRTEAVQAFVRMCERHGIPVLVNLAPYVQLPVAVLKLCSYVVVNRGEASQLTGLPIVERADAFEAARRAAAVGPRNVVITLGNEGCVAVTEEGQLLDLDPYRVDPVDSTGAGDSFVGALALAISKGDEMRAALRFAGAVGAVACTRQGAQSDGPLNGDVERLMNSQHPELRCTDGEGRPTGAADSELT
jgi:ribokinase